MHHGTLSCALCKLDDIDKLRIERSACFALHLKPMFQADDANTASGAKAQDYDSAHACKHSSSQRQARHTASWYATCLRGTLRLWMNRHIQQLCMADPIGTSKAVSEARDMSIISSELGKKQSAKHRSKETALASSEGRCGVTYCWRSYTTDTSSNKRSGGAACRPVSYFTRTPSKC
jgi:hypothetical protein